ncbi:hypothetical protein A2230_01845 [candidate division WOR-1 bacterium RIFOXYA2_FULL_36_21]|uniref:Polymerase beta nucleotidyltransferase domain-containing protein n=1 Tax=candidate division WOR-1 bacterium RIFOXYB2_FULL_36_35 TaxID=1802578 RepID=A0A1F4S7F7_UNCSA|nr:MAG: hypothetical protein A2230_01845 [candidate division WOR-1 bacterium RIFOXYA2_FULL_36_21]OGC16120.1 MAG: hypothetical protein A2282_05525 [candidate division WOR-1 bacterium RIFOXYA12_FULL_36_13]OGC16366.1 MAG: hypothetical protein A2290_04570 [candidate division WOR-1 bacterium RIFOXYB2_FULL_36_35]
MYLKNYPVLKIKKDILSILEKYLDVSKYKIFFFGSRVIGAKDDRSDIDIGIEGEEKISREIMRNIREEMKNIRILYKIDFVDFKNVSSDFKKIALQNIEKIL